MNAQNVVQVWSLANATANQNLIEACVPLVAAKWECLKTHELFLCHTEAENLKALLSGCQSHYVEEEEKLRLIEAWMNASPEASVRDNRAELFEDILSAVELKKVSSTFMIDSMAGELDFELPRACKKKLLEAWKKERSTRREPPFKSRESIIFYGRDMNTRGHILSFIPQLQSINEECFRFRFHAPYRDCSNIVLLKGW